MTPLGALGCLVATAASRSCLKPGAAAERRTEAAAMGILAGILRHYGGRLPRRHRQSNGWAFLVRRPRWCSVLLQTALLVAWMLILDREALLKSIAAWRQSIFAGLMGAFASQCWFIAFALTSAANVRTLALVEVLFAQAMSKRVFAQDTSSREKTGMILIVVGVAALLAGVVG
jgi:drug/metabolite transporter (DMT)-like permease